jgi:hypothetical protein
MGRDGLGDPGAAGDLADDPPGAMPVQPPTVPGQPHRPVRPFPDGQVDRLAVRGASHSRSVEELPGTRGGLSRSAKLGAGKQALRTEQRPGQRATLTRLRQYPIFRRVLEGGVVRREVLSSAPARDMYLVGYRHSHHRAFMSLVRHWPNWA